MQELIFAPHMALKPLKLGPVLPLLEYLQALPQVPEEDRPLSAKEDAGACKALRALPLPEDALHLERLILHFSHPAHERHRTLGVWYGIARAVARLIQEGD